MNILLTSVGRRTYLIKYFQEVIRSDGLVHVCNSHKDTLSFKYADRSVVSPLIHDKEYIPFLLDYCKTNEISVVVPLFDIDLPVLAKNQKRFAEIGTRVIVSTIEFVDVCNDKWKTHCFLRKNGFSTPRTFLSLDKALNEIDHGNIRYPLIVKPRFGMGSISISRARDRKSLEYLYNETQQALMDSYLRFESSNVSDGVIVQEMLEGQEYGVDIINDLKGSFRNAIIKKKLAMRAGETDIAETVDIPEIFSACKRLGQITGHVANLDCDVFLVNGFPYILEMNARFGGGYPFSHIAGANLPMAITKWATFQDVSPSVLEAEPGVLAYKEMIITIA